MPTEKRQIEKDLNRMQPEMAMMEETSRIVDRLDELNEKLDIIKDKEVVIPEVQKVEITNHPEMPEMPEMVFPTEMKVEVMNFPKFPEQKAPIVNVQPPQVKIEAPIVNIPETKFPTEMKVEVTNFPKDKEIPEVQKVRLVDKKGNDVSMNPIVNVAPPSYPSPFQYGGKIDTVKVSNTVTVNDLSLELSQGSATSEQAGPLIQAAVTTAAPSYTTGTTNPLSLTAGGSLRTTVTAITGGTGATSLGKGEDGGHTTGDTGVFILGVRNDGGSSAVKTTSADADYSSINTDAYSNVTVKGAIVPTYAGVTATFTPAASATDIFHITGSSTKTIKILRVILSGTQTTSGGVATHALIKRTSANSGGTSVATTVVPMDTQFPASTVTIEHYTANPTLGGVASGGGTIYSPRVTVPAVSTAFNFPIIFDFNCQDMLNGQPIVLRGTGEQVVVNLSGTTPTGAGNYSVTIIWNEE